MIENLTIERRLVELLGQDVVETVGASYEDTIVSAIALHQKFTDDAKGLEQRVVDEIQQILHDTFVDTTWPACPEHSNHPLWYSEGWWCCEQSGTRVAPLGSLRRGAAERQGRPQQTAHD